jgi:aspartate carbamoyltransferase
VQNSHILSVTQFQASDLQRLFYYADQIASSKPHEYRDVLAGLTLACVFYEPSTRTSSSFIAAMSKLGGNVIPITQGVQFSSVSKGETLEDTITTLGQYADAIVLRHPETGAVQRAAKTSPVPVINAGDGIGEHPTQAFTDLYTIRRELGRLENLHVAFVGDLAYGRTVHSLVRLLTLYPNIRVSLISPERLILDAHIRSECASIIVTETAVEKSLHEAVDILEDVDVVYMTRVQKERFISPDEYAQVKDSCLLTPEIMGMLKPEARVLHPLPRVNEIPAVLDTDPRSAYFRQVKNGLWTRMGLLAILFGK